MKIAWVIILAVFAALGSRSVAQNAEDHIVLFDAKPDVGTFPTSINENGEITGYYFDSSEVFHGFMRDPDGSITTFDAPGAGTHGTFPVSINGRGEVGGYYYGATVFVTHGFVRHRDGTITSFDVGPSTQTFPAAINARGQITGYYSDNSIPHGFVRDEDGTTTTFTVLGASALTFPRGLKMEMDRIDFDKDWAAPTLGSPVSRWGEDDERGAAKFLRDLAIQFGGR